MLRIVGILNFSMVIRILICIEGYMNDEKLRLSVLKSDPTVMGFSIQVQ